MADFLKINKRDNVVIALKELKKGQTIEVENQNLELVQDIPMGHKIAIQAIAKGVNVIKYGYPIGMASTDIEPGAWVHTHNVKSNLGELLTYTYEPEKSEKYTVQVPKRDTFEGYKRSDGTVGIRNEVWIIPTVGCVNGVAKLIKAGAEAFKTDSIDGIYAYSHPHGCSQLGDDQLHTQKILSGLIHNPNAGAVLVLGLGCENNQISLMKKVIGDYDAQRVKFLVCQDVDDEVESGIALMKELCQYAATFKRETCDASNLVIGLKCGGSDGFSGITANPLVGEISNKVISVGGSSILTEVPEMFGAETVLMNRARNGKIFSDTVDLINDFKKYFMGYGEKVNENPSPGNKAGGITTLEDKSLGCVQKSGDMPVEGVLDYGDRINCKGLNLLNAPGNDLVASNALAAAGAQIVLFTTGRGTPFASPVPTVKIASNSKLAEHKKNWIDFNAGRILEDESMDTVADDFWNYILDLASGEKLAKSEKLDKSELAIFKNGVTL